MENQALDPRFAAREETCPYRSRRLPWRSSPRDLPVGRWLTGPQEMNQTYLDTARLLTQVAPLV